MGGVSASGGPAAEKVLKAEFEVAHPQDALDGAFAQFACQGQDIRGDTAKLLVLLVHAVQLAGLRRLTAFHCASG